jgi:hypothetical protein|tara:strand:- start:20067 stop:20243 length:177 start_codon:yes stop_codon:yes gene_type:complete
MATNGDGSIVTLGRHGGGSVVGASAGLDGAAVVTVRGDGVVVYDCDAQVRLVSFELFL